MSVDRIAKVDPFDLGTLDAEAFSSAAPVAGKRVLSANDVRIRKPSAEMWFRVHPSPEWRKQVGCIELKETQQFWAVSSALIPSLEEFSEFSIRLIITGITRTGTLFLWPLKLALQGGKPCSWFDSAREAAALAETRWVKIQSDSEAQGYRIFEASCPLPEPVWPDEPFPKLLELALRGNIITGLEHPTILKMLGRA